MQRIIYLWNESLLCDNNYYRIINITEFLSLPTRANLGCQQATMSASFLLPLVRLGQCTLQYNPLLICLVTEASHWIVFVLMTYFQVGAPCAILLPDTAEAFWRPFFAGPTECKKCLKMQKKIGKFKWKASLPKLDQYSEKLMGGDFWSKICWFYW